MNNLSKSLGIILTNTGTPNAPTTPALREYLSEFLGDEHIVQLPKWLWLPILHGIILPFRSKRSAKLYQKIWRNNDSPMRTIMKNLQLLLEEKLANFSCEIVIGMNYGQPSLQTGIKKLLQKNIKRIIVLPLFPQFSFTTTAASIDKTQEYLDNFPSSPKLTIIKNYASHELYIEALTATIKEFWNKNGRAKHLLISFHGIPKRYANKGDPYPLQCEQTAKLLATALELADQDWTMCYQSRFGYSQWLQPSTQQLFIDLPKKGIKQIDVVCPGFAVDCLETLEEIEIRGKAQFMQAGGDLLQYIPALNTHPTHIDLLKNLILNHTLNPDIS